MEFETISFKGMSSHAHARTICSGSAVTSAVSALHFLKSYSLFTPTSGIFFQIFNGFNRFNLYIYILYELDITKCNRCFDSV